MKLIFGIAAMLLPVLSSGQQVAVKPLHIGDKLPSLVCNNILNYKTSSAALSAFKGKVIILDFWATWCSSCVSHLPAMDSLQMFFKNKLQCILVSTVTTGDSKEKVQSFLKKKVQAGDAFSLPVIIGDTLLTRFFPHRLLPHYVWINANGAVCAITDEDAVTAANINTLFNENRIALPVKQDVMDYNSKQPLLQDGNGGSTGRLLFRSTLTRYLEGLPSGGRINDDGINKKVCYLNMPILSLYQAALGFDANRIIVITKDSGRYFKTNQNNAAWHNRLYCYEYTMPLRASKSGAPAGMLNDLNNRLGLYGRMEMRKVACYVLIRTGTPAAAGIKQINAAVQKPSAVLNNEPPAVLVQQWNSQSPATPAKPIILDETAYTDSLTLELYATIDNLPALKKELQSYGFDLIPATRELNMFVLSELHQP